MFIVRLYTLYTCIFKMVIPYLVVFTLSKKEDCVVEINSINIKAYSTYDWQHPCVSKGMPSSSSVAARAWLATGQVDTQLPMYGPRTGACTTWFRAIHSNLSSKSWSRNAQGKNMLTLFSVIYVLKLRRCKQCRI